MLAMTGYYTGGAWYTIISEGLRLFVQRDHVLTISQPPVHSVVEFQNRPHSHATTVEICRHAYLEALCEIKGPCLQARSK